MRGLSTRTESTRSLAQSFSRRTEKLSSGAPATSRPPNMPPGSRRSVTKQGLSWTRAPRRPLQTLSAFPSPRPTWLSGSWTRTRAANGGTTAIGLATLICADCSAPPSFGHGSSTWREDFGERWDRARAAGMAPDLIAADKLAGLVRELETKGRLIHVQSERLSWMTEVASCDDFARRWRFLVAGSAHGSSAKRALDELLRPGPGTSLPGPVLSSSDGRGEAVAIARQAATAFVSGDPRRLKEVASESSPQLSRCTAPEEFRSGWTADAGAVEIRGNASIAFAKVETRYHGKNAIRGRSFPGDPPQRVRGMEGICRHQR